MRQFFVLWKTSSQKHVWSVDRWNSSQEKSSILLCSFLFTNSCRCSCSCCAIISYPHIFRSSNLTVLGIVIIPTKRHHFVLFCHLRIVSVDPFTKNRELESKSDIFTYDDAFCHSWWRVFHFGNFSRGSGPPWSVSMKRDHVPISISHCYQSGKEW